MFHKELFKDKVALVTGGGSGIGFTISKMILEHGGKVVIVSRNAEKLSKAAEQLSQYGSCTWTTCDIRVSEEIEKVADFIKEKHGKLDILVNNAGGQFPMFAEAISDNGWNAVIRNNLSGTFFMTRVMANKFFIPQQSGSIVSIIADIFRGIPGMAHTAAARAGVQTMSMSVAIEWCKYNIRVNCVAPGIIDSSGLDQYPEEIKTNLTEAIPMHRYGTTDEVAKAVLFLASDLASFTTGETLYVDGGRRLSGELYKF